VFVGLYIAANPGLYHRGMIKLVPPAAENAPHINES
jgi:hypothetical protein